MTHGRGAWNNSGAGGTRAYNDPFKPGPYYYLTTGSLGPNGSQDNFAVFHAVKAYQRALNRRLGTNFTLVVDGIYGEKTLVAVKRLQERHPDTLTAWGGIGPDTSKAILLPDLELVVETQGHAGVTPEIVSGIVRHESGWDAGAVGFIDNDDLGLAQINGPAHPALSDLDRLRPKVSFQFIVTYLNSALHEFSSNQRDAIASYNLGFGGARTWIGLGRPQWFTPTGTTTARDVWAYIDSVLEG